MKLLNSHLTGVSTFASRTSPSTNQSLQKSFLLSRRPYKIELKRKSLPSENKKYADRQESKMTITEKLNIDRGLRGHTKEHQAVTGVCCQWRFSASYDSDMHIETYVLRGKYSAEIAIEQHPPIR